MRVLGIDEAGRGCVLGNLVVGAFFAVDPDDGVLRAAGADDSKRLSAKKRRAAREALAAHGELAVIEITPASIDRENLNRLEERAILTLIERFRPDVLFIDALGHPNAMPGVIARLQGQLDVRTGGRVRPRWTMEPKADRTYPVVGAASIVAKTTRDAGLAAHCNAHGPLGSGYPSDPKTRSWLTQHARTGLPWPPFVRTRWQTVQDLAQGTLLGAPQEDACAHSSPSI